MKYLISQGTGLTWKHFRIFLRSKVNVGDSRWATLTLESPRLVCWSRIPTFPQGYAGLSIFFQLTVLVLIHMKLLWKLWQKCSNIKTLLSYPHTCRWGLISGSMSVLSKIMESVRGEIRLRTHIYVSLNKSISSKMRQSFNSLSLLSSAIFIHYIFMGKNIIVLAWLCLKMF